MKSFSQNLRTTLLAIAALTVVTFTGAAFAQTVQIQGLINARNGATMTVQTINGNVIVLLTDNTNVDEESGLFHARKKQMAMTALMPGLQVQVQGTYNAQNQLVADNVKFKGSSLQTASDIQAGVNPVQQQEKAQQQQLAQQQAQLQEQQAQLQKEKQQQQVDAEKIAANKAAVEAVNKRFGELGDYNIWDEVTVYFANGKVTVDQQYVPKLIALCQKAKTINGYVVQVKGYASKVGSAALNQKLSQERATNVVEILEQQGNIPLTNMLAPGAMGTSDQVASDSTSEGQAEDRRVVVMVLQSKALAGT